METIKASEVSSISIRNRWGADAELDVLGSIGEGDNKLTLYRGPGGIEVIQTNGDPVWDGETGFGEARKKIMGDKTMYKLTIPLQADNWGQEASDDDVAEWIKEMEIHAAAAGFAFEYKDEANLTGPLDVYYKNFSNDIQDEDCVEVDWFAHWCSNFGFDGMTEWLKEQTK